MRRRQALRWIVVSAVVVGGGAVAGRLAAPRLRRMARAWLEGPTRLRPAPPIPLAPATAAALQAVTETLLAATPVPPASTERYTDLFRWKSLRVPGYGALYARLAAELDRATARAHEVRTADGAFARMPVADRRAVLDRVVAPRAAVSRRALLGAPGSERWVYRARVTEEILRLFARTDAMTQLGYEAWPGQPRFLDAYRAAPPGARA